MRLSFRRLMEIRVWHKYLGKVSASLGLPFTKDCFRLRHDLKIRMVATVCRNGDNTPPFEVLSKKFG
jgi:hypothetical protein